MQEVSRRATIGRLLTAALVAAGPLRSQTPATTSLTGPAAFVGHVLSKTDSTPVALAEVRLLRIDSSRTRRESSKTESAVVYVDSAHARLGVTDSTGAFAIRRLGAGTFLFQVRRLGFAPLEGTMTVDTGTLRVQIPMQPTSHLLAAMTITESAADVNSKYLNRVGYTIRSRGAFISAVATPSDFLKHPGWWTVHDYLQSQDIRDGAVMLDGFGMPFEDAGRFPLNEVLAIEVYRNEMPLDLEGVWPRSNRKAPHNHLLRGVPYIAIWTLR